MKKLLFTTVFIIFTTLHIQATVHFVDAGASGNNDGSSWANAFTNLQTAISAAQNNDTLFVKDGTYTPNSSGATFGFELTRSIHIYGSFDGTESSISERNIDLLPATIINGDHNLNDIPVLSVIATGQNRGDNAKSVFGINPSSSGYTFTLDGISILNGHANLNNSNYIGRIGGGIGAYTDRAFDLNIERCHFETNYVAANNGGGAAIGIVTKSTASSVGIVQNININRTSFAVNYSAGGGGVILNFALGANTTSNMVIKDSRFIYNDVSREIIRQAKTGSTNTAQAHMRIYNSTFAVNTISNTSQGSIISAQANGTSNVNSTLVVRNSIFHSNAVSSGFDVRIVTLDSYLYNNYYDAVGRVSGTPLQNIDNVVGGIDDYDCSSVTNAGNTNAKTGDDLNLIDPITFTGKDLFGGDRIRVGEIDLGDLEFQGLNPMISSVNDTLMLVVDSINCSTIQWVDCDNNNQPISGATSFDFQPTQSGNYAVQLTYGDGTVVETSDCFTYIIANTDETLSEHAISIFPNPVTDVLNIATDEVIESIRVFDITGKPYDASFYNAQLNTKQLPRGIYIINIQTKNGRLNKRFVKQ